MQTKKRAARLLIILVSIFACALLCALFIIRPWQKHGHLRIGLVDAYSLKPLPGATVVLPEFDMKAVTDKYGMVNLYDIPVVKNQAHNGIFPVTYGEITLLAYCEGYLPHALFFVHIYPDQARTGVSLYLFPIGTETDTDIITMIESPNTDWARQLLEKYHPDQMD